MQAILRVIIEQVRLFAEVLTKRESTNNGTTKQMRARSDFSSYFCGYIIS